MEISRVGYQPVFDRCRVDDDENFEGFRQNPKYNFACANGEERVIPDYEALAKALIHNPYLATKLLKVGKPNLGYKDSSEFFSPDTLDCRHIMSLTHLFSHVTDSNLKVVEIGGGFGNWARLALALSENIDCEVWTIIDIPAMIKLQKWYLGAISSSLFENKVKFMDNEEYRKQPFLKKLANPDIAIGAHSLSEFPMSVFNSYYEEIIINSRFLYYSTHRQLPHHDLVNAKLERIEESFTCVNSISSEGGVVLNTLYRKNE